MCKKYHKFFSPKIPQNSFYIIFFQEFIKNFFHHFYSFSSKDSGGTIFHFLLKTNTIVIKNGVSKKYQKFFSPKIPQISFYTFFFQEFIKNFFDVFFIFIPLFFINFITHLLPQKSGGIPFFSKKCNQKDFHRWS